MTKSPGRFVAPLTQQTVQTACGPSAWDFGNEVLYTMVRQNPLHEDPRTVIGKVWIIGRAYAAAVERRKTNGGIPEPRFYENVVAKEMLASDIDLWIAEAQAADPASENGWRTMVAAHHQTTRLFQRISGHENRSLASKYLHFHVPGLFYLFDRRATIGLAALGREVAGRASHSDGSGENSYRKHAERCRNVSKYCQERFGIAMTPRQLDNLLLATAELKLSLNR